MKETGMSLMKHDQNAVFYQRFEAIMHPLSEHSHGPDHDRLRQLYVELLEQCVGDPLKQARYIVLREILQSYLSDNITLSEDHVQEVVQNIKLAISSLALLICQLEESNLEAASASLEAAQKSLVPVHTYLHKTSLNHISSTPEVLMS
jgi:hypothetical protein